MKKFWIACGLMLASTLVHGQTQDYPVKPLKIIVPVAPGSAVDFSTRFHAEKLGQLLGRPVVVENRPGAETVIAMMAVKDAPADGYTLLAAGTSSIAVNPWTVKNLPYDPLNDFKPFSGLFRGHVGFIVSANSKLKSINDLVATGRAKELFAGSYTTGYSLFTHLFASQSGIKVEIVPYKGLSQVLTDVLGERIDLALVDLGGALPFVRDGRVRVLAVSGENRNGELPEIPTARESGFPNYVFYTFVALYVRAEVPDAIVNVLANAMRKVMETKEAKDFALKHGAEQLLISPDAMAKFQRDNYEAFGRVAKAAGITPK